MLLPVNSHANYRRSTSVIPSRYILVRPREEPTSAFSLGAIISISLYLGLAQREPFRRWSRAWLSGDATEPRGRECPGHSLRVAEAHARPTPYQPLLPLVFD